MPMPVRPKAEPLAGASPPLRAVSAIVERDGALLMVLRANPPAKGMYAFPGGRVEPGETLEAAALRELCEETGLTGANPRPLITFDLLPQRDDAGLSSHYILTVFLIEDQPETDVEASDDAAHTSWYSPEEIRTLPVPESVLACLDMLATIASGAN